jgi:hypothetical protein
MCTGKDDERVVDLSGSVGIMAALAEALYDTEQQVLSD